MDTKNTILNLHSKLVEPAAEPLDTDYFRGTIFPENAEIIKAYVCPASLLLSLTL